MTKNLIPVIKDIPKIFYDLKIEEEGVKYKNRELYIAPVIANIQVSSIVVMDSIKEDRECEPITTMKYKDMYIVLEGQNLVMDCIQENIKTIKAKIYNYLIIKSDLENIIGVYL